MIVNTYKQDLLLKLSNTKESFKKGIIVETGAGCPLYNILCTQANTASKLIKYALSPTDFDYTKITYNLDDNCRAVDEETVLSMIRVEMNKNSDAEWIFTNSIQIGNDPKTQTHGWLGYKYKETILLYHFTINNFSTYNRVELLELIQQICLDVFLSKNDGNIDNGYIDRVLTAQIVGDSEIIVPNGRCIINNIVTARLLKEHCDDTYLCYSNGEFDRFNGFIRRLDKNKELVIFKGSFDPLHPQHYDIYQDTINKGKNCVLMISINNREANKTIDISNLFDRMKILSYMNIPFIINTRGYYDDCIYMFENHPECKDIKYSFVLGDDTLIRILEDNKGKKHDWSHINFYVVSRNQKPIVNKNYSITYLDLPTSSISSTVIRNEPESIEEIYKNHPRLLDAIQYVLKSK